MRIREYEWWIVLLLGMSAFLLAIIGFNIDYNQSGVAYNFLDIAFNSIRLFGMNLPSEVESPLPWQLEIARWLAPGVVIYTAAKAILYFIRREYKSLLLYFKRDYIIVTSLNEKSRFLVKDLIANKEQVVVISDLMDSRKLDEVEKEGAIIIEGDISNKKFLGHISAEKAKHFVFMEDDDEKNISNAISVYNYLIINGKDKKQAIFTHVADDIKLNELVELKFFEKYLEKSENNKNCEIRVFSMYERTARVLFNTFSPDVFTSIKPHFPQVHVGIFGSGRLAQSMILRLARIGHFVNLKRIKVTLFQEGDSIEKKLNQNFPGIAKLIDIETIDEPLSLFDIERFNEIQNKHPFDVVYVLSENDSLSSNVLKKLIKNNSDKQINVVLSLMNPAGILNKWYHVDTISNLRIHRFSLFEESFTKQAILSEKIDRLAKQVHAFYLPSKDKRDPEKGSNTSWENLSIDIKNQNREQADHIAVKLRAAGFDGRFADNVSFTKELTELLAEVEHRRWYAHMILCGWIQGEKRDEDNKTHPDLIPYHQLEEKVKTYDKDVIKTIPALLKMFK